MSPEQAQGNATDARTDIFSFGVMLYEMFSKKRAAAGTLESEPLQPEALDRVVKTCLAESPDDRFQSAADLARAIVWSGTAPELIRAPRRWLAWSVAATLSVCLAALAFLEWRRGQQSDRTPLTRLTMDLAPTEGAHPRCLQPPRAASRSQSRPTETRWSSAPSTPGHPSTQESYIRHIRFSGSTGGPWIKRKTWRSPAPRGGSILSSVPTGNGSDSGRTGN